MVFIHFNSFETQSDSITGSWSNLVQPSGWSGFKNSAHNLICFCQGASSVHFQDLNAETIRCTTIPNVLANLDQARDSQSRQQESPLTPSRQTVSASVRFYAGEWEELPTVLSVIRTDAIEPAAMSLSFSEEDFNDGCSSQDGSVTGQQQDFFSRRSRKLSGSRAWERANESDQGGECGYDVILMTEIPYSVTSLKKLYSLIKKVCFLILLSLVLDLVVVCFIVIVMVVVSLNSA